MWQTHVVFQLEITSKPPLLQLHLHMGCGVCQKCTYTTYVYAMPNDDMRMPTCMHNISSNKVYKPTWPCINAIYRHAVCQCKHAICRHAVYQCKHAVCPAMQTCIMLACSMAMQTCNIPACSMSTYSMQCND